MYFRNFTTLFVNYSYLYFSSHGVYGNKVKGKAPVVQTVDSAIQRINVYPVDSAICFPNTYPLGSDLSGGYILL